MNGDKGGWDYIKDKATSLSYTWKVHFEKSFWDGHVVGGTTTCSRSVSVAGTAAGDFSSPIFDSGAIFGVKRVQKPLKLPFQMGHGKTIWNDDHPSELGSSMEFPISLSFWRWFSRWWGPIGGTSSPIRQAMGLGSVEAEVWRLSSVPWLWADSGVLGQKGQWLSGGRFSSSPAESVNHKLRFN